MDQKLLFLINRQWTNPTLDRLMALMSSFAFWMAPLAVFIVLVFIFGGFKARAMIVVLGIIVGISDGLIANSLKKIVHRPRPHEVLADVRQVQLQRTKPVWMAVFKDAKVRLSRPQPGESGGRSFPSAHTVDNFAAAMVLTIFYRRIGWVWFLVAALVAYSRIYVGSHWPSDVLESMLFGIGLALLLVPLCEVLWRKAASRLMPDFFARHPSLIEEPAA